MLISDFLFLGRMFRINSHNKSEQFDIKYEEDAPLSCHVKIESEVS